MFAYVGVPSLAQSTSSSEKVKLNRLEVKDFKCKSLDSIVVCAEKLEDIVKRNVCLMGSLYHNFKTNFNEKYLASKVPRSAEDFENFVAELKQYDEKYNECDLIEGLVDALVSDFDGLDAFCAQHVQEYACIARKHEKTRKKMFGDLAEVYLNVIAKNEEETEFLRPFFVVVPKDAQAAFRTMTDDNHKISSSTITTLASDENYVLLKVYGMKSAGAEIGKLIVQSGYVLKEFQNEEDFAREKVEMEKIHETSMRFADFIEVHVLKTFRFYAVLKLTKLYLDCLLIYGLPPKYTILCVHAKKRKDVVRCVCRLAEASGLYYNGTKGWAAVEEESLLSSADLAVSELKFQPFDEE